MSNLPFTLGVLATVFTCLLSVNSIARFFDSMLRREYKQTLSKYIDTVSPRQTIVRIFLTLFDSLFRIRTRFRPSLTRSILVSSVIYLLFLIVWILLFGDRASGFVNKFEASGWTPLNFGISLFFVILCTNYVGDFFSVWETRWVIGRLDKLKKPMILVILLDLVASIFIFVIGYYLAMLMIFAYFLIIDVILDGKSLDLFLSEESVWLYRPMVDLYEKLILEHGLFFRSTDYSYDFEAIGIYTTLTTSIWLWISILGTKLAGLFNTARKFLKLESYPIFTITLLGSVSLAILIVLVAFLSDMLL